MKFKTKLKLIALFLFFNSLLSYRAFAMEDANENITINNNTPEGSESSGKKDENIKYDTSKISIHKEIEKGKIEKEKSSGSNSNISITNELTKDESKNSKKDEKYENVEDTSSKISIIKEEDTKKEEGEGVSSINFIKNDNVDEKPIFSSIYKFVKMISDKFLKGFSEDFGFSILRNGENLKPLKNRDGKVIFFKNITDHINELNMIPILFLLNKYSELIEMKSIMHIDKNSTIREYIKYVNKNFKELEKNKRMDLKIFDSAKLFSDIQDPTQQSKSYIELFTFTEKNQDKYFNDTLMRIVYALTRGSEVVLKMNAKMR